MPIMSNIVVTRPLSQMELDNQGWKTECPLSDTRDLLFYYRMLSDKRLLFGTRGDTTGTVEDGERMKTWMKIRLGEQFPAWKDVELTHFWKGFICATRDFVPSIGQFPDDSSVYYGLGYHGTGIAFGTWTGLQLAKLVQKKITTVSLPLVCQNFPRLFPFHTFRLWYLRLILSFYRIKDELD